MRKSSGIDVREKIIAASRELLNSRDYHEAVIDKVASKAKVAKGTVFLYFGSKENLLREVLISVLNDIEKVLTDALSEENVPSLQKIKNLYERYVDFTLENANLMMTLRKELIKSGNIPRHHKSIIARQKEMSQKLSSHIEKIVEEGVLRKMPSAAGMPTSEIVLSMMMLFGGAVGHMVLMHKDNPNFEKIKDIFWDILSYGILSEQKSRTKK